MPAQGYRDHIYLPHLLPFYRCKYLFWGTLLPLWKTMSLITMLAGYGKRETYLLPFLPWPVSLAYLNPTEEVWRLMKEQISSLPTGPSTREATENAIWSTWAQLDNSDIQAIVDSMPHRIQAVLAAQASPTHF